ncbi:MAG: hypothetical protein AAF799_25105 [Myxococcota bacterium]
MRLPQRGVLIRLFIYIPLIGFFGWRAWTAGCAPDTIEAEPQPSMEDRLAPHRKTITLPDGTQQDIVELTPQEAEAILGHPIPEKLDGDAPKAKAAAPDPAAADAKAAADPATADPGGEPDDAKPGDAAAKAEANAQPGATADPAPAGD